MTRKIALKRLTRSDLTLFRWHYQHENAGNQKAINLNRDVFVDQLYPGLQEQAETRAGRFPLDLYIYGPASAPELNLQRKIIKWGEYKNWRLNGELIENPIDDPQRFNSLREGDIALFEFTGLHFPDSARVCLIDQGSQPALHAEIGKILQNRKMMAIDVETLDDVLTRVGIVEIFPVNGALIDGYLEDAAQGGFESSRRLARRASARPLTREELEAALTRAAQVGSLGEEFINHYLETLKSAGEIEGFEWVSLNNAIAPYDFHVVEVAGKTKIDVKATSGAFSNALHISLGELVDMAESEVSYRIYRVSNVGGPRAELRISKPLAEFGLGLLSTFKTLPPSVKIDSVSVDPTTLQFGPVIPLELPTQED